MDLLFIVRDGLSSSLVGNLLAAIEAKQAGREVSVLFTQDALATLARGTFEWPRELALQEMRWVLNDNGKEAGLASMGGRGEGRQLNVKAVIEQAIEAGVPLVACPTWLALLGLSEPPAGLKTSDGKSLTDLLQDAKQVIGSL